VTDDPYATLRAIVDRFESSGVPYMVVGSIAALAHGRSRATQDFDVVAELDAAHLRTFLASLPPERFYVSEDAALDALLRETLFNVIDLETGWKIDVVPRKRREFSRVEFGRRRELSLAGVRFVVASLEDTQIAKLEWSKLAGASARQLEDAAELLHLAGQTLDRAYVEHWVSVLDLRDEWSRIQSGS
jgi:hypothetical protein